MRRERGGCEHLNLTRDLVVSVVSAVSGPGDVSWAAEPLGVLGGGQVLESLHVVEGSPDVGEEHGGLGDGASCELGIVVPWHHSSVGISTRPQLHPHV